MLLYFVKALGCVFYYLVGYETWNVALETKFDDLATCALVGVVWIWNEFETGDWYIHPNDTRMFGPIIIWILEEDASDRSIRQMIRQHILVSVSWGYCRNPL